MPGDSLLEVLMPADRPSRPPGRRAVAAARAARLEQPAPRPCRRRARGARAGHRRLEAASSERAHQLERDRVPARAPTEDCRAAGDPRRASRPRRDGSRSWRCRPRRRPGIVRGGGGGRGGIEAAVLAPERDHPGARREGRDLRRRPPPSRVHPARAADDGEGAGGDARHQEPAGRSQPSSRGPAGGGRLPG